MSQSGIGYSSLILGRFTLEKEGYLRLSWMRSCVVQIGGGRNEEWLWIAIEPVHSIVLGIFLSRHRNMLVIESFLRSLIEIYGRLTVYSDGRTGYPEACSLELKHRLHACFEKSLIKRTIQYFKDRAEHFDDHYPCIRFGCDL